MQDPMGGKRSKPRRNWLLELDSWIDASLYDAFRGLRERYSAYAAWIARFHVSGFKRVMVELLSDAATLSIVGGMIVLTFAQPAFDETDDAWRSTTQYSVTFTDRYGRPIGKRGLLHNDAVPLEEIPDHMIKAALATEDRRFFEHIGIDFVGLFRAMSENVRAHGVVQGGSTLTQQLAKNLFLTPERTIDRKIKEAFLALWLEVRLTKREILKLYLDRAYLGGGTVGVDAAAEYYFGKSVRDVTLAEAAMLAGLFKAPTRFAPHLNLPAARARANVVLDNMVEAGFLTEGQVYGARHRPATIIDRSENEVPNYFLDWAFSEVQRLHKGDDFVLTVKTTADTNIQRTAEAAIESSLRQHGQRYGAEQGAMVVMDLDGAVRAMVGGRDYGESQFNRATDALRQPGSSFKPFTYLTAMMNGYTPQSVVVDAPITIGNWSPKNYSRSYRGPVTLDTALTRSINTIPVRLSQSFGRDKIADTARLMGIRSNILVTRALPLGVAEVTVLDMTSAYAAFANGGKQATGYAVLEIKNSQGEVIYDRRKDEPPPRQLVDTQYVADLNFMLSHVVEFGTGRRAQLDFTVAAGKTGTTQAYRDAWFMGYTGKYAAGVWFGKDDFTSTRRMTGGSLPAMTWKEVMAGIHTEQDIIQIVGADDPRGIMQARESAVANADGGFGSASFGFASRPSTLSERMIRTLERIEHMFSDAPPVSARGGPSAAHDTGPAPFSLAEPRGAPGAVETETISGITPVRSQRAASEIRIQAGPDDQRRSSPSELR
jgi:penicillin-binding protein 1A